jgi:large subunit ribosomal protein L23
MRNPRDIVVRPVVTERSTQDAEATSAYTFVVARDANKIEIRRAVETLFDVKVLDVRTMNYRGKTKRVGRSTGRRPSYKKAIVKLAKGQEIDVYEGV